MTLLTQYSQIDTSAWEKLLKESPVASWFQSNEAYCFFDNLSFTEAFVVAVVENGTLMGLTVGYIQGDGGMLKKRLSRRAIIIGGPLLSKDITESQLSAMLTAVRRMPIVKKCIYIETRNLNNYSHWRSTFEACNFRYVPHYNFHFDTTDPVQVDKNMDKSRRRRIRRATERGVSISNDTTFLPEFYNILSNLYHTKIHKPLPPYSMFEKLAQTPYARYFFVQDSENKTIGGQLILMLDKRVAYAWYCCGLDKEYPDLYPSIMANYAAIRYAADNGFVRYDMMGGGSPGEEYGVRDFKAQFGGKLVEHGRYLHVCNPIIYWLGCKAIAIISHLKR